MISRAGRDASAASRSASSPSRSPSTIRRSSRSNSGSAAELLGPPGLRRRRRDALEQLHEPVERVVGRVGIEVPSVVDEVEGHRTLLVGDLGHRQDLRRRDDGGVEARVHAFVQEHRVQHLPRGCVEAERDVGDAQRGLHIGAAALELADRLDGLERVAAHLLLPGGDREGQGVDDDVGLAHAVVGREVLDEPLGDPDLPFRGAGLALLVDAERHDGGAVLVDQLHRALVARPGPVAVLEVHRVDDAAPAEALQARPQHLGLGRVEHHGQRRGGGEAPGQLGHVGDAVTAHVVDAQVDQVRALAGLLARDADACFPVLGQHGLAELLGPVRVGPLADHEHRRVLAEGHRRVERADPRLRPRVALGSREAAHRFHQRRDVLRRRAAAATDEHGAVLGDESGERRGELVGRERVLRAVRPEQGQPRVRHHRQRDPGVLGEGAQVLAHLGGPRGAVQPDEVDAERLQRGERGADLRAEQHRAGGLDGDLRHDRHPAALGGHRPAYAQDGRLGLQQVLAGLDDDRVRAARDETAAAFGVGVAEAGEGLVTERRQLRAGPDRAEHEPWPVRRRDLVGHLAGQYRRLLGELADPFRDAVLGEVRQVRAERVGLDRVRARREVGAVNVPDHVGPGVVEDFVAAFEAREVVEHEIGGLQHGAHRAVGDDDPIGKGLQKYTVDCVVARPSPVSLVLECCVNAVDGVRLHGVLLGDDLIPHGSRCGVAIRHSRPRRRTLDR